MDYAEIRDEHILRARQSNDPSYVDRAELFINQAVRDLARCYRHYDLEETAVDPFPGGFVAGDSIYALPADLQTLVAVEISDQQATLEEFVGTLEAVPSFQSFLRTRMATGRVPTAYSRFGREITLAQKPDRDYTVKLYYYKYPADPDYVTPTSPEFEEVWHPHVVEYSLMIAGNAVGESVVTEQAAASFQLFAQMMPDARLEELAWPAARHSEVDQGGSV